ncbi:MAG TPA: PQQ-binding-like beta-propeller repeat protein [Streptosporangiaceae bacterium]|nr:PQQ-binding-like beta-propeller repeat protein [Streptosporangiaceae bacterium]
MRRGSFAWTRRGMLAAALLAIAVVPYPEPGGGAGTPGQPSGSCAGRCRSAGAAGRVLWNAALPGKWRVSNGLAGTVPAAGQAYAAAGGGVVALGIGLTVYGYSSRTGARLWQARLPGFPPGAAIVSVRAWPGVVTAGVAYGRDRRSRAVVVLASLTGRQVRRYPAAPYGGAVAATARSTVIVGPEAVISADDATGAVRWRLPTGPAAQAWRVDGRYLYVTVAVTGYLGSQPVTALRRINMDTGQEVVVRPPEGSFQGTLGAAAGGVVLFSSSSGVTAYDGATGRRLWSMAGAVPEGADLDQDRFYLTDGTTLLGVGPRTGRVEVRASGSAVSGSAGMYAVVDGVALGLDRGPDGDAWGYDLARQRVTWTTPVLPWPHFFVDIGGIGGSVGQDGTVIFLAACGKLAPAPSPGPAGSTGQGPASGPGRSPAPGAGAGSATAAPATGSGSAGAGGQACQQPELVAVSD